MILRAKLTSCRSFILLVTIGLIFLTVNITLIWNQQQSPPHNICVCEPSINVPNSNDGSQKKPPPSLEHEQEEEISDSPLIPQAQTVEPLNSHQLAVVVPFRDRYEEMMTFIPHIHNFLDRQKVRHQILVINQADKHRWAMDYKDRDTFAGADSAEFSVCHFPHPDKPPIATRDQCLKLLY